MISNHFFIKYKLQARIFDQYHKLRHRYDPPIIQKHHKVFYAMYDDDHVYTLNHNLNQLSRTLEDNKDGFVVYSSSEFYIDENKKPVKHFMINSIDDIVKVARMVKEAKEEEEPKEGEDEDENKKKDIT